MKRITVIEDNEPDLMLLEDSLDSAGIEVELHTIEDGLAARNYFEGIRDPAAAPDLILLDLNVPKIDGVALLESIRHSEVLKSVSVIVWSSTRTERDFDAVNALSVSDFLVKPADLAGWQGLAARLRDFLSGPPGSVN